LDEADGTLWLVNASRLVLERRSETEKKKSNVEDEVRYFEEDDFAQLMDEEDLRLTQNIKRFVNQDPASPREVGQTPTFKLRDADRYAGVRVPEELLTFYWAEQEMLRQYTEEVANQTDRKPSPWGGGRAVGLHTWFRWWARASGLRGRRLQRPRAAGGGGAEAEEPE